MSRAHGVGFGVPFFVSGLYKVMGKLADRISFGVHSPRGGWVWGAVLCVSGLYKFMGKLADRISFGVQGPRLGLGCRSLCLACISLWEN